MNHGDNFGGGNQTGSPVRSVLIPPRMSHTELGLRLARFVASQSEWSQATFGTDAVRGPIGVLKHLEKEAREAIEAQEAIQYAETVLHGEQLRAEAREEIADCFILIMDVARRAGMCVEDLLTEVEKKHEKNKTREWTQGVSPTEPVHHVKV